ncbi:hypothetical protein EVAR_79535_1 [Eumeta japonica]|uniref:Uncharacterized protein n=1 Tax=Eumeta variegata TaxID=151549 RepID=A0A4C1Y7D1_EUMVA|nr:hypothetical protein EVAR_79535_1 [Eumeta japonica]
MIVRLCSLSLSIIGEIKELGLCAGEHAQPPAMDIIIDSGRRYEFDRGRVPLHDEGLPSAAFTEENVATVRRIYCRISLESAAAKEELQTYKHTYIQTYRYAVKAANESDTSTNGNLVKIVSTYRAVWELGFKNLYQKNFNDIIDYTSITAIDRYINTPAFPSVPDPITTLVTTVISSYQPKLGQREGLMVEGPQPKVNRLWKRMSQKWNYQKLTRLLN